MKIRSFIAIELNKDTRQAIKGIRENLKTLNLDVTWVKPKNIHLTLKFFGDIKKDRVDTIIEVIHSSLKEFSSFEIELTELGAFPADRSPRILWIGIGENEKKVIQIAKLLEDELGKVGFKKERREFSAHITIGRVRSPKNISALNKALRETAIPPGHKQMIEKITLFKSTLTSQGPIYEALDTYNLAHYRV